MYRSIRAPKALAGCLLALVLHSACAPTAQQKAEAPADGSAPAGAAATTPPAPRVIAPITLSGRGKQATQVFKLEGGVVVVRMTHQGSANFAPKLLDDQGELVELLANEIGPFEGARVFGASEGQYVLDVEASGPWTITIEQPRPTSGAALPQSLSGSGQSFGGPLEFPGGLVRFQMRHSGKANWAVKLLDSAGELVELLANEIGPFEGSKAVGARKGIYWLDITADGAWTITITK